MEGLLVLLGLAVLSVPVLLIIALVSVSGLKRRVSDLEQQVSQLHAARASRSDAWAPRAESAAAPPAEAEPEDTQPTLEQILRASAAPPVTPPVAPSAPPPLPVQEPAAPDPATPPPLPLPPRTAVPPPVRETAPRAATQSASQAGDFDEQDAEAATETPYQRHVRPPSSDPLSSAARAVKRWFTVGNVPVKIGILVLFAGVAALLKYASDQGWLRTPPELKLAAVAAAALGALVFAWRKRESHRSFALSLQGGAIGVLLLTVFAAFKRFDLLEATPAFALSVVLVFGAGALAVLQNAKSLAVFAILAGFLAPIWLSTGSGNHVALFSYYAVLNAAILGVAWYKPWRVLNLLGFVFTFGIGSLWGIGGYTPAKFGSTEPFLLLFFAFYLIIPLLYARRLPESRRGLVDACLVFGTPLIAFSLQAAILDGARMTLAWNALGLAALYVGLAAWLRKREGFDALVPGYAVLGVGFATLAVPLALTGRATACVFALEGAAMIWWGLRQQRWLPQVTGSALQLLAATAFLLTGAFADNAPIAADTPIANATFMVSLVIALAGFASAWCYSRRNNPPAVLFYLWGLAWWLGLGVNEIGQFVAVTQRADALLAFAALTGWLAAEVHRRQPATLLALTSLGALLSAVPLLFLQVEAHAQPFAGWGAAAWAVYALLGVRSLICLRNSDHALAGWAQFTWLLVWPLVLSLLLDWICRDQQLAEGWRALAVMLPWLALCALSLWRWSWLAAPLGDAFDNYRGHVQAVGFLVLMAAGVFSLLLAGNSAPLPWVVVVNPLEVLQLAILALLAYWLWHDSAPALLRGLRVPMLSAAAFALVTVMVLRAVHHWGGLPWDGHLIGSKLAQTSLTVVWSVLGVMGWVIGSRRGQRMLWLAGAVLMGVVLVKLLLVDRGNLGDALGIASFIAYGLLCTVVGYLAPVPPRNAAQDANA